MKAKLSESMFKTVVENTPLIAIDLIVENLAGEVLLGRRLNKPAKDYWFIPGGRIFKSETMSDAFNRLARQELNLNLSFDNAVLQGAFEHFYEDSFVDNEISTHYVVLAYNIFLDIDLNALPDEQHHCYKWFDKDQLLASDDVHQFTKNYFQKRK